MQAFLSSNKTVQRLMLSKDPGHAEHDHAKGVKEVLIFFKSEMDKMSFENTIKIIRHVVPPCVTDKDIKAAK